MLTFVHLSDLHLVPPGRELHGLQPDERLATCVSHIAREHGDAAFYVVSGDLTHDGDALAYASGPTRLSDANARSYEDGTARIPVRVLRRAAEILGVHAIDLFRADAVPDAEPPPTVH